jgi:L-lactate dehydrogenase complex protein LldE
VAVGLFVPCYVDQLRPAAGIAALELLESLGVRPEVPREATCCGQPFTNAGRPADAAPLVARFAEVFGRFDAVVVPSASCVASLRRALPRRSAGGASLGGRVFEICEYVVEALGVAALGGRLDARVGLHASCHALRELGFGAPSERPTTGGRDPARTLLSSIEGLEIVEPTRPDECCGFGGVFAVEEPEVSCRMGADRLADHHAAGAAMIVSTDVSCLLHLDGVARRRGAPVETLHVVELIARRTAS